MFTFWVYLSSTYYHIITHIYVAHIIYISVPIADIYTPHAMIAMIPLTGIPNLSKTVSAKKNDTKPPNSVMFTVLMLSLYTLDISHPHITPTIKPSNIPPKAKLQNNCTIAPGDADCPLYTALPT